MTWKPPDHRPDETYVMAVIFAATQRHDPRTLAGREKLVTEAMPAIRRISDPVFRDGYLQLLARVSGVDERVLREVLDLMRCPTCGHRPGMYRDREPVTGREEEA